MRRRLLQLLAAPLALAGAFVLVVVWGEFPRTKYAPGFSVAGFKSIQPGQSEAEVLRRLGEPLASWSENASEQWCFGNPRMGREEFLVGWLLDWPTEAECLSFRDGVVVGETLTVSSPGVYRGQSVAEVERRRGRPLYILPPGPRVALRYSEPQQDSDNYESYLVYLDGERIVRGTQSFVSLD